MMQQQAASLPSLTCSADYLAEHAYLVARGVRALAIVDHVPAEPLGMLHAASLMERAAVGENVTPFVVDRGDGFADCGFAAARWVVDLYEWIMRAKEVPSEHRHRMRGLLLGYSVEAIRVYDERGSGRRFTASP